MTAGMAFEAMNNAGYLDSKMIVILNDNKQVSDSRQLARTVDKLQLAVTAVEACPVSDGSADMDNVWALRRSATSLFRRCVRCYPFPICAPAGLASRS